MNLDSVDNRGEDNGARHVPEPEPERQDPSLGRQLVRLGGTFASLIAGILIAAGQANVDGATTRWALVALCLIAAMTFYTVGRKH